MKKNLFLAFLFCTFLINSVNAQSTISITAPNGGEILTAGQTYNITWMSTGIETIQIAYSLNAGASWTPIASSANATTGAYSWTVPDIVSSTVIIGVIDNLNLLNNDASNAPFSIIAATQTPVLNTDVDTVDFGTITAGGKGNVKTFTLSGSNLNEDVTLTNSFDSKYDLSVDGGGSYYTSTTIPYNLVSENNRLVYVRFTGQENDGLTYFDSLRITSGDAEDKYVFLKAQTIFDAEPSIIVTSPNGGEQFAVGSQQNITWTSAGISTVDIYYVINGFINNLIETNVTASSGTFSWTVPNENSSNVQIKVVSSTNSAINDLSDERFTIAPATKSIQVTSPNGGEQWTVGSQHTITWITTGIDVSQELEVRLSRDGGLNYYILTDGSVSYLNGSYTWTVNGDASETCLVKVRTNNVEDINDVSDAVFSIAGSTSSVEVLTPNGGESLTVGSTYNITWNSTGIDYVIIEYSDDGGAYDWYYIEDHADASLGTWAWTVPNKVGTNNKVRITSFSNNQIVDISDATFAIVPAATGSITVLSPNGGEQWAVGSQQTITWTTTGIDASQELEVRLSRDGGLNYYILTDGSVSYLNGSYTWTVNGDASETCLVKVRTNNVENINDVSDAVFSIAGVEKSIEITSPNGGENWEYGSQQTITWNTSGIEPSTVLQVRLSRNGGEYFDLLTSAYASVLNGSYTWTVTGDSSENCLISIRTNIAPVISDTSDASFSISGGPSIQLLTPNGGEILTGGSQYAIKWQVEHIDYIMIQYSLDSGNTYYYLSQYTDASLDSFIWTLPNTNKNNVLVRIRAVYLSNVVDVSDEVFSIVSNQSIQVTSPNGGEQWAVGSQQTITWTTSNIPDNQELEIRLSRDGGLNYYILSDGSVSYLNGSYTWTVNGDISDNCLVKVRTNNVEDINDISDAMFSITGSTSSVQVLNPNGGESLTVGSTCNITWNSTGVDYVIIEYSDDGGSVDWYYIEDHADASLGTWAWTVPDKIGTNNKVRITSFSNNQVVDMSDATFAIVPAEAGNITVLTPNGGEQWAIGSQQTITWTTTGIDASQELEIRLSRDNGKTFNWINDGSVSMLNGSFTWTVTGDASDSCLIKVRTNNAEDINDVSDAIFSISGTVSSIELLSPDGGETINAGSEYTITWSSIDVSLIKIEYSVDSGETYQLIADSIDASLEEYIWNVPDQASSVCLVKVTDVSDKGVLDISSSVFSIIIVESITNYNENTRLIVYPNPANQYLNVNGLKGDKVEIYNSTGNLVFRTELSSETININWLPEGMYLLVVYNGGQSKNARFIKVK